MPLPRLQAFEFHDLPQTPTALRETVVETLSRALSWGRMLDGLVAPFSGFVEAGRTAEVLDLCSGAGGPAVFLSDALQRRGQDGPRFVLTDLHPRPDAWTPLVRTRGDRLRFEPTPVDATAIAPRLAQGRARVIINALHHFPPALVRAVFADAVAQRSPIFVAEAFARQPAQFINLWPAGLAALLLNPLLAAQRRAEKAFWTWLTPVALGVCVWDGLVSTLRTYTEAELRGMVADLSPAYRWTWGRYAYPPAGTGYFFYGVPA